MVRALKVGVLVVRREDDVAGGEEEEGSRLVVVRDGKASSALCPGSRPSGDGEAKGSGKRTEGLAEDVGTVEGESAVTYVGVGRRTGRISTSTSVMWCSPRAGLWS